MAGTPQRPSELSASNMCLVLASTEKTQSILPADIFPTQSLLATVLIASGIVSTPAYALSLRSAKLTARDSTLSSPLFPVSPQVEYWTTATDLPDPIPLSDATFNIQNNLDSAADPYVDAPDGELSMQASYPAGSYNVTSTPLGGVSFYALGPASVNLTTAKEVTFSYSIYFPFRFQFAKGGQLPGLVGGESDIVNMGCDWASPIDRQFCFSMRPMWGADGAGVLFAYVPPEGAASLANQSLPCGTPPYSSCNGVYVTKPGSLSLFTFETGSRTTVAQRMRLNDVGAENGELELFVNGESVANLGGIVMRADDGARILGIEMQTFFGGSDSSWASPVDQDAYIADFSVAITEML
ncbi:hypothetical protein TRAPUB_7963 [Trametes pubescens]|uniref:Polysaccharide lyase 14 domain-containing protein n=1 Tax=Trametes pubescens TaxID=154538 RepID=A0A1M2V1Y8_TRAPU|nr:hypothetical protein TRAPUB_7963 [Trametes pubescens]